VEEESVCLFSKEVLAKGGGGSPPRDKFGPDAEQECLSPEKNQAARQQGEVPTSAMLRKRKRI